MVQTGEVLAGPPSFYRTRQNSPDGAFFIGPDKIESSLESGLELPMFAEPNESHYGILRLPVNGGTADMFAKWPILAEKASLRRVNAAWLSRSERRAYAYSTLRPPTFSGDTLPSAVCFFGGL